MKHGRALAMEDEAKGEEVMRKVTLEFRKHQQAQHSEVERLLKDVPARVAFLRTIIPRRLRPSEWKPSSIPDNEDSVSQQQTQQQQVPAFLAQERKPAEGRGVTRFVFRNGKVVNRDEFTNEDGEEEAGSMDRSSRKYSYRQLTEEDHKRHHALMERFHFAGPERT